MIRVRASLGRFAAAWRGDALLGEREGTTGLLKALTARRAKQPLLRAGRAYDSEGKAERRAALEALAADRLPFEEYVLELALLGLHAREHSLDEYAAALGAYTSRNIEIAVLSNAEFYLGAQSTGNIGESFGRLVIGADGDDVCIEVPAGLSPWLNQFTVAHELGHLAAAHPPRVSASPSHPAQEGHGASAGGRVDSPSRRLARKPPLASDLPPEALDGLHEAEADLRAQYAIITGALGPLAVETSRLGQIG